MAKILIIEDDKDMRFVLEDNLQAEGHETDTAARGADGVAKALTAGIDLVILDLMLPDMSGIEVCKQIRAQDADLPVVILTAKTDEIDKVVGLEVGADDYVTKPFGIRELQARIKAILRRTARAGSQPMTECTIGDATLDLVRREARRGRQRIALTRYEADLLRFLAENRGRVVSRATILQEVWGAELSAGNRTVDNYVARVRGKLETDPARPQYIHTVHGEGYKLV